MSGLLQPQRRWKKVHGGYQTQMRRCPDCAVLILAGDASEHDEFHIWLDGLADQIQAARRGAEAADSPLTIEELPPGEHEPTWEERMPRYERLADAISTALANAWLAVFPRRPPRIAAELPPPTITAPPPIPVPNYVQEQARRQVERAEQRRTQ